MTKRPDSTDTRSELKVTDFGIARSLSDSMSLLTMNRGTSGTPVYMSPQQFNGEKASPLDDIYSMGATLYELLTSKPPFYSGNIGGQIENKVAPSMKVRRAELEIVGEEIPAAWEKLVAGCLAKEPARRPQSAGEVASALGLNIGYYATAPQPAVATQAPKKETIRVPKEELKSASPKRGKGMLIAALVLLVAGGAFAGWWLGIEKPRREAERQKLAAAAAEQQQALVAAKAQADEAERQKQEADAKAQAAQAEAQRQAKIAQAISAAEAAFGAGDYAEARKQYQAALALDATNARATSGLEELGKAEQVAAAAAAEKQRQEEEAKKKAELQAAITSATKENPWENSLGMKFVPVPGAQVLFSIWDTRVQDYQRFVDETGREWPKPSFEQGPTHPAVMVSCDDANAYCKWLTEKERKSGTIADAQEYRLPTDHEWSAAVGGGKYPWGNQWPPPVGAGNYATSLEVDDYKHTSPVGSFGANEYGLFDMGGNVWQWCEDWYDQNQTTSVDRGASWNFSDPGFLLSSFRSYDTRVYRSDDCGFRCVLVGGSSR
jgi:formylglycine-generating enzyme required for sulfatase activity